MSTNANTLQKIEIIVSIGLILVLTAFLLGNPNITGYLSLDFVMQDLNLTLSQSQNYIITSTNPEPFILTSFKISGEVIGDGRVEVYLDNNQGQQLLVYKNVKQKQRGMGLITGMFIAGEKQTEKEKAKKESYLVIKPGEDIQNPKMLELSEKEETVSEIFSNECTDTCFIKMELSDKIAYNLIFKIEPGTTLKLDNIVYTIEIE